MEHRSLRHINNSIAKQRSAVQLCKAIRKTPQRAMFSQITGSTQNLESQLGEPGACQSFAGKALFCTGRVTLLFLAL